MGILRSLTGVEFLDIWHPILALTDKDTRAIFTPTSGAYTRRRSERRARWRPRPVLGGHWSVTRTTNAQPPARLKISSKREERSRRTACATSYFVHMRLDLTVCVVLLYTHTTWEIESRIDLPPPRPP